jgi:hypothetical protein
LKSTCTSFSRSIVVTVLVCHLGSLKKKCMPLWFSGLC